MPEDQPAIVITVTCHGVIADCLLNGFRIFSEQSGETRSYTMGANEWVVDGENTIRTRCVCFGIEPDPGAHFGITVNLGNEESELYKFRWESAGDITALTPVIQEDKFWLDETGRNWAWQEAEVVEAIEDEIKEEIFQLVTTLHQSIDAEDIERIRELSELKDTELCRAYDISSEEFYTFMEEVYREFFGDPARELSPLEFEDLMFHSQAGGKAIQVTDTRNAPPIRTLPDSEGAEVELGVIVSRINNEWKIIR